MFGKKEKRDVMLVDEDVMTFLGKGTHFKGTLHFEGTVRIDGEVEGEIITQGTLIVGERGIINAEVSAGVVIVGGRINGNVHASQRMQMLTKSTVTGAVNAPSITIEDGALLNGICEMKRVLDPSYISERRLIS
jgi:cytoskeletal protein CcmA (bactofilin family)